MDWRIKTPGLNLALLAVLILAFVSLSRATEEETPANYQEVSKCDNGSSLPCHTVVQGLSPTVSEDFGKEPTNLNKSLAAPAAANDDKAAGSTRSNKPVNVEDPYDRQGRYWLVPPFLIGASSVIVLYIFMHCLYLHCYAKKRIRKLTTRAPEAPTILLNDAPSSGCQPITPMVKYDGANGRTEVVEAQPFLICHPIECETSSHLNVKPPTKRRSVQLQLPKLFGGGRNSKPRHSVTSASAVDTGSEGTAENDETHSQKARASICFVPVGQTVTDNKTPNSQTDWTPLQGFVYSSFILSRKPSYNQAVMDGPIGSQMQLYLGSSRGSLSTTSCGGADDRGSTPIIFVPGGDAQQQHSTGGAQQADTLGNSQPDDVVSAGITITISPDVEDVENAKQCDT